MIQLPTVHNKSSQLVFGYLLSLEMLASNCLNLERLALCVSDIVGDLELMCIAAKCKVLKKLCIKNCPVSEHGMEALANGCPKLVKLKVNKCRAVTLEGADWLKARRASLDVNMDTVKDEYQDTSASDAPQENFNNVNVQLSGLNHASSILDHPHSSRG